MGLYVLICSLSFVCAAAVADQPYALTEEEQEKPNSIIANGYAAHRGKAPYIVGFEMRMEGIDMVGFCSGSIIGHNWILTAAHCIATAGYVDIHYGFNLKATGQFTHRVHKQNFIRHPLFPRTFGNDIGLIRTPYVYFTSTVNKVGLPRFVQGNETFENQWAVTCGWGAQANGEAAEWLQCVDVQIMGNKECKSIYSQVVDSVVCIQTSGGRSTCRGDSGGPLVTHRNPTLVGITSFVSAAGCTAGYPAGFTRITAHLDWIHEQSGVAYF